jgi:hypothetical protein
MSDLIVIAGGPSGPSACQDVTSEKYGVGAAGFSRSGYPPATGGIMVTWSLSCNAVWRWA